MHSAYLDEETQEKLNETVVSVTELVLKEFSFYASDLNGTHVLRAILCVLAGLPVLAERKGKGSKHQHSIPLSESLESVIIPGKFFFNKDVCCQVL